MNRIDKSSLLAMTFVAVLAITTYFFQSEVMSSLRLILEKGQLQVVLLIATVIIIISHAIKIKSTSDSSSVMIRSGLVPLDIFLTLSTYTAVTTTACSLLEGAFIQKFYDVKYFNKFSDLDIYVLLGVAALLLWYVAFHMYKMCVELLFKTENVSISTEKSIKIQFRIPPDIASD